MKSYASPPPLALLGSATLVLLAACGHGPGPTLASGPQPDAEGAIVTTEDLQRNSALPLEQVLMARVPGLRVARTADGGLAFRLRGTGSVYGSTEPLVVLDGMVADPAAGNPLAHINPNDIARIEVLRDAAETSMYGVRGANGVIVITTRQSNR